MAAVFLSLTGSAVMLLSKASGKQNPTMQYRSALLFILCAFCYSSLYFLFFYKEKVLAEFELSLPWRIADYTITCLLIFSWICFMENLNERKESDRRLLRAAEAVTTARILFSYVMTGFFMNDYYTITVKGLEALLICIDILFITLVLILIACACRRAWINISIAMARRYILAVSTALSLLELSQPLIDYGLYVGKWGVSAWELEKFDSTGPIFIFVNLVTLIFVFKADFTPIYISSEAKSALKEPASFKDGDSAAFLDLTAEKYRLTHREREVMGFVYEGFSNPDIAEDLFISRNTVKIHLRNIYEKLGVSTRIEMIHLVNSRKKTENSPD
jgi:DNA-binding CsgD family transcriptional regulator